MKHELLLIIKDLTDIKLDYKLNISDECIFEQACGFLRGAYANNKFSLNKEVSQTSNSGKGFSKTSNKSSFSPSLNPSNKPNEKEGDNESCNSDNTPSIKLITPDQIDYIQQLSEETHQQVNLTDQLTTKEASEMIKSLNKIKFSKKEKDGKPTKTRFL